MSDDTKTPWECETCGAGEDVWGACEDPNCGAPPPAPAQPAPGGAMSAPDDTRPEPFALRGCAVGKTRPADYVYGPASGAAPYIPAPWSPEYLECAEAEMRALRSTNAPTTAAPSPEGLPWCGDKIWVDGAEYVRADLVAALVAAAEARGRELGAAQVMEDIGDMLLLPGSDA